MRLLSALALTPTGLSAAATAQASAQRPPLDGESLAGAVVTMTSGARCPSMRITCDPISLRVEGRLRYTIADPFTAHGIVDMRAYGSRDAVTQPYFVRTVMSFAPVPASVQPR